MFLRVVRATVSKGVKRDYVRVVEAYRDDAGKTQHRTVINLGRRDVLAAHLDFDKLRRLLHGDAVAPDSVKRADVDALGAWDWGPMLAARALWSELGLDSTLDRVARRNRRDAVRLSDRALVLVANRLTAPGSEHALAQWLESDFVCDRDGRRFVAAWRDDWERLSSRTPRVRVAARQLQQWYRTLDQLHACKDATEHALFLTLRDLFSLRVDMVFYDLTSTYFEGAGPPDLGAHGNRRDAKTVPEVLRDLETRFGLKRVVFVGDRGMVTSQNLDGLRSGGHGYIVGRNRRRSGEVFDYIQSATGPWIECRCGIAAREKAEPPKTLVQEVAAKQPGVRVFVVHSEERAAFERAQRVKAMERVRTRLVKLERRVAAGRLKAEAKIGAAAARILGKNHGHRYYDWSCADGVFRFVEHPGHFPREQAYEGKYVIQTEEPDLSAVDAVRLYKELSEVERAFANLKDVIDMRPIYHRSDHRVEAHIYVAALAFLIHRAIEKKLKAAGLDLSATEALNALKSVRVVDIALGDGSTKRCVTRGSQRAATVLGALGITDLDPPTPPQPGESIM